MPSALWNHRGLYFDFHFSNFRVGITAVYHFPFLLFLIAQLNQGMCKLETLFRCRGSLGASGHASALQKSSGTCFSGKISVQIWQPEKGNAAAALYPRFSQYQDWTWVPIFSTQSRCVYHLCTQLATDHRQAHMNTASTRSIIMCLYLAEKDRGPLVIICI